MGNRSDTRSRKEATSSSRKVTLSERRQVANDNDRLICDGNMAEDSRHEPRKDNRMTRHKAGIAAAVLLPAMIAYASDLPKVKEGLWEIRGQSIENPGARKKEFTYKLCRNHAYDEATTAQLKNVKGCSTTIKDVKKGMYSSSSTCTVGGTTIVSSGLTTYIGDAATHSEAHATYTPAYNGKTDETVTQDQQYLGDCPAGMKPGEMLDQNGAIRHQG